LECTAGIWKPKNALMIRSKKNEYEIESNKKTFKEKYLEGCERI
jgi:hypothetical protein